MNTNAISSPIVVHNLRAAPFDPAFTSQMWFFDLTIESPDGPLTLVRNKAFRSPRGSTWWQPFALAPHYPDHPDKTVIVSLPSAWAVAIERAVSDAIDAAERQVVAS